MERRSTKKPWLAFPLTKLIARNANLVFNQNSMGLPVNTALMRLRTRNRHPEVAIQDLDLSEVNEAIGQARQTALWRENPPDRPDEQLQSAELLRQIETAVNHLPHNLRAIFLLRAVGEVSTQDSAARLGVSIPTAKTRLNRARRVLRASLGDYVAC